MRKRSEHITFSLSNPVLFFFTEGENTEPTYIYNRGSNKERKKYSNKKEH